MTLFVEAKQRLGDFLLDAGFTSTTGVTALFGPSGSGKTSLIRVVAGLSRPDAGRLILDGETLLDTQDGVFVPKHRRRFGYVFQEARLFPHLNVWQNLSYGRWFAPRHLRHQNFDRVVELLGLGGLLHRRPARLSGGEKQRVAIGRALLSSPRLLLMDEPLTGLDDDRKAEILPYLERLRDESRVPIIYVSHSVAEVSRLADHVVMMRDGRVQAAGRPKDVLGTFPSLSDERGGSGVVLFGIVETVDEAHQLATVRLSSGHLILPTGHLQVGRSARMHIPERDVLVATRRPEGLSALNILEGRILALELPGDGTIRVRIECGGDTVLARITALSAERLKLEQDMPVFAIVKTVALEQQ